VIIAQMEFGAGQLVEHVNFMVVVAQISLLIVAVVLYTVKPKKRK
jgi:hypothetical protein